MRLSGWVRVAIVFTLGFWVWGVWSLVSSTFTPDVFWTNGFDAWQRDWLQWISSNGQELGWIAARPILILLAAWIVLKILAWIIRGFMPRAARPDKAEASQPVVQNE